MDYKTEDKVVMAPAYSFPNVYFIFRSAYEQVKILVLPNNRISSSHRLTEVEIDYIKITYPFIEWA